MFQHNLLLIFRNFKRFKSTFFINLIGLSTGLACTLLIYLWVTDELNVDKFHDKDSRLYRVMENRLTANGIWTALSAPGLMGESLEKDIPEVEYAINSSNIQPATVSVKERNIVVNGRFAGKEFFSMFSYDLVQGDERQVLSDKNSLVISDDLAMRLFNTTENVVGRSVELDHETQYLISGIFRKVPASSSEQFDFVGSFEKYKEQNDWVLYWGNTGTLAFVLLKPGADVKTVNSKIAGYIKEKTNNEIAYRTPFLNRYSDNYLYGNYENGVQTGGRITYVKLFSIIAIFILLIACINFMNLSTAKASRRIKEVGIKKAMGAGRRALMYQYLGESLLMSFLSLLLAILIVDLFLPSFNVITGKHLVLTLEKAVVFPAISIALFTGLIAGSYPAFYLSGFNPSTVLKGKLNSSLGELWARKGLVLFQFTLSVIFIVSVLVVYKQMEFVQSKYLGYNKENIIYFRLSGELKKTVNQESFIAEMKRNIPGVINASSISHRMTGHNSGTNGVEWEGKDPNDKTEFENMTVNYDLIETLGIHMAAGRAFSKAYSGDTAKIIFNEAGIKFMGLKDPIGKTIKLWGKDRQIIGIAKDFHFESLHKMVKPLFLRLDPENTYLLMGKLAAGKEKETIAAIEALYKKFNPEFPFEYKFLDTEYQAQYVAEQRVAVLSKYFAGLAVLISCLGLFGLAAFSAERRLKEIGIRKVLGSSELGIIYLLSSDFTRIVAAAIAIALPLSFLLARYWLSEFAFKISLEWWFFIAAGLVALFIAWLTVGTQAFRAARINPTKCLRDE